MENNNNLSPHLMKIFSKSGFFAGIFIVTIIRLIWNFLYGFRWPSAYVLTNSVFTYDFGYIPRSLVASVLKLIVGDRIYSFKFLYILIVGVGLIITFIFGYLSYYFTIKTKNIIGSALILWYSLSIYSAYLAHEMGYFEQYGYILILGMILVSSKDVNWMKFCGLCAALMFISLLISETNAFLVCPVFIAMSFIKIIEEHFKENAVETVLGGGI